MWARSRAFHSLTMHLLLCDCTVSLLLLGEKKHLVLKVS